MKKKSIEITEVVNNNEPNPQIKYIRTEIDESLLLERNKNLSLMSVMGCIALHLYTKLPITIKLIDSLNTFKSNFKAFLFSRAYNQSGLTVQEDYAL